MLAVIAAVTVPIAMLTKAPRLYPVTPAAWVQAWSADSLQDPAAVCHHLYAPALAARYTLGTGEDCMAYYQSIHMNSFRIVRTIVKPTFAVIQGRDVARQPDGISTFTITLERIRGGWRAIAIVPGPHA